MHPEIRDYIESVYLPKSRQHQHKNKMIINKGAFATAYLKKAEGVYDEVLQVDAAAMPFRLTTAIHGDTTLFISYDPADMTGLIIDNPLLAEHMRSVYGALRAAQNGDPDRI